MTSLLGVILTIAATALVSSAIVVSAAAEEAPRRAVARVITKVVPGASTVVVVDEGELEPRSVGSYSVRTYAGTDARFPYDRFIAGTVRPRDGAVDTVLFADVDHDGSPEIVVVIRSAGTGGRISADALRLRGNEIVLVESVSGLAKDADPVAAIEAKLAHRATPGR